MRDTAILSLNSTEKHTGMEILHVILHVWQCDYIRTRGSLSSRTLWLVLNTSVCRVYCIVTGSCRPFKRSAQKRFELVVERELFVADVYQQLSW